ncbi:MAG: trigger factor [Candidatus Omnitrophota bacterium]
MKSEVKKIDPGKREVHVEARGDLVKNKFEDVYARLGKEAKIKGFRQGHIPRDILEKNFSAHAHEQVMKELIPELYNQALEKEKLMVVDSPQISDVKIEPDFLAFKALVEVTPDIEIKKYKGLKINYTKVNVAADELKRNLDSLKESHKLDKLDDFFARSMGYPDVPELEKSIERQIMAQKDNQLRQNVEAQVIEQLTKDLDFRLPQALVERQLQDLLRHAKLDLALKGVPKERIAEEEAKLREQMQPEAKKQIKTYLILSEIAKRENIPLDDHMPRKVMEFLFKEANWEAKYP